MTRQIIGVKPDTNLLECAKKLVRKKVDSLVLSENKKFKGFISTQDILWAMIKKSDLSKVKASDISPRKIVTIKPETTLEEAIQRMKRFKFHKLPVVKNGEVVGLLTLRDIINFYPELNQQFKQLEDIKEETEKMKRLEEAKERVIFRDGICEECGERGQLYRKNGLLVCPSCLSFV